MVDLIQADYEQLRRIADRFATHGEATAETVRCLAARRARLGEIWRGESATAFFRETDTVVLLALRRLAEALQESERVTRQVSHVMRAAEEEAAALFRGTAPRVAPRSATPDPNAAAEQAAWESRDAWYRARGRAWNPVTGRWDKPILSDISDVNVARQLLGEAGVTLDGSWSDAEILHVAMGVGDIARVTPGGITRLRELFGGEVIFHRRAWDPNLNNRAHVPPPLAWPGASGRHVYFPRDAWLDKFEVVHELAHVLDWNSSFPFEDADASGQIVYVRASAIFPRGGRLSDYASDPFGGLPWYVRVVAERVQDPDWEYWAEGFSIYVYGPTYPRWPDEPEDRPNSAQREFIKRFLDGRSD